MSVPRSQPQQDKGVTPQEHQTNIALPSYSNSKTKQRLQATSQPGTNPQALTLKAAAAQRPQQHQRWRL